MPALRHVHLDPGKVYRTSHLAVWAANPTRLAGRLEAEGRLRKLSHGFFYAPVQSRFGEVPPSDEALLNALLDGTPWLVTGPPRWNALGLGSTQMFSTPLVYNTMRSGRMDVGGRTFQLRRVAFPVEPKAEWFVVDLLRNAGSVGLTHDDLEPQLRAALKDERFSVVELVKMVSQFGRKSELALVRRVTGGL
jgi:hypothetical protein